MKQSVKSLLNMAACLVLFAGVSLAQKNQSQSANRMGSDTNFVTKAAQGGMAEVELGKLAQANASSEKVKEFGKRMVDDHSKANEELTKIAAGKSITMPTSLDSKDQATRDKLSKLNGAAFDKAYMEDMVKDHKADISEFNKESEKGMDPDMKDFAAKTLPTLREHLTLAQSTLSGIGK